jgi:hypothetical protein
MSTGYIAEISNTQFCPRVIVEHRVDRLGQLGAAVLVNATGIDPYPFKASTSCEFARPVDLSIALRLRLPMLALCIREPYLVIAPTVAENTILGYLGVKELFESEFNCV